jgi:hypothetical protein
MMPSRDARCELCAARAPLTSLPRHVHHQIAEHVSFIATAHVLLFGAGFWKQVGVRLPVVVRRSLRAPCFRAHAARCARSHVGRPASCGMTARRRHAHAPGSRARARARALTLTLTLSLLVLQFEGLLGAFLSGCKFDTDWMTRVKPDEVAHMLGLRVRSDVATSIAGVTEEKTNELFELAELGARALNGIAAKLWARRAASLGAFIDAFVRRSSTCSAVRLVDELSSTFDEFRDVVRGRVRRRARARARAPGDRPELTARAHAYARRTAPSMLRATRPCILRGSCTWRSATRMPRTASTTQARSRRSPRRPCWPR